jgi:hypothetical protein
MLLETTLFHRDSYGIVFLGLRHWNKRFKYHGWGILFTIHFFFKIERPVEPSTAHHLNNHFSSWLAASFNSCLVSIIGLAKKGSCNMSKCRIN